MAPKREKKERREKKARKEQDGGKDEEPKITNEEPAVAEPVVAEPVVEPADNIVSGGAGAADAAIAAFGDRGQQRPEPGAGNRIAVNLTGGKGKKGWISIPSSLLSSNKLYKKMMNKKTKKTKGKKSRRTYKRK